MKREENNRGSEDLCFVNPDKLTHVNFTRMKKQAKIKFVMLKLVLRVLI